MTAINRRTDQSTATLVMALTKREGLHDLLSEIRVSFARELRNVSTTRRLSPARHRGCARGARVRSARAVQRRATIEESFRRPVVAVVSHTRVRTLVSA